MSDRVSDGVETWLKLKLEPRIVSRELMHSRDIQTDSKQEWPNLVMQFAGETGTLSSCTFRSCSLR
jgi:hypothetical protein